MKVKVKLLYSLPPSSYKHVCFSWKWGRCQLILGSQLAASEYQLQPKTSGRQLYRLGAAHSVAHTSSPLTPPHTYIQLQQRQEGMAVPSLRTIHLLRGC